MRTSHNLKGQPRKLKERQGLQQATIYFNLEGWDSAFIDLAFQSFLSQRALIAPKLAALRRQGDLVRANEDYGLDCALLCSQK